MSAPRTERLRWHQVVAWLDEEGISRKDQIKLLKAGTLKGKPLFSGGRNYYFRSQVQRDVLDKHTEGDQSHAIPTNGKT